MADNKEEKRDIKTLDIAAQFEDELELLKQAQEEVEELYDDIHQHYLQVRKSKGTLHFTQAQTSNLITLKTTKVNIIKERVNLKRNIIDFELKRNAKETETSLDEALVNELLKKLNVQDTVNKNNNIVYEDEDIEGTEAIDLDEALDAKLEDLTKEGLVKFNEEEQNVKNEHKGVLDIDINKVVSDLMRKQIEGDTPDESTTEVTVVVNEDTGEIEEFIDCEEEEVLANKEIVEESQPLDFTVSSQISSLLLEEDEEEYYEESEIEIVIGINTVTNEWEFMAIDMDGQIIDDYILPSKAYYKITFDEKDGYIVGYDQNGDEYKTIEIE